MMACLAMLFGCSRSSGESAVSPNAAPPATRLPSSGSAPTTATAVAPTTSTAPGTAPDPQPQPAKLELSVYWVRPFGRPDRLDIPAYRDTEGGSFPYVLYGLAANTSDEAIEAPAVNATWRDSAGEVIASVRGAVVDPDGRPLAELAPGGAADFVIVVDDPLIAARLEDREPELQGVGR